MIKFRCKDCNHKISVPKIHAGRKGKCPKCKSIVVIPKVENTDLATGQSETGDLKSGSKSSGFDLTFLDIPHVSSVLWDDSALLQWCIVIYENRPSFILISTFTSLTLYFQSVTTLFDVCGSWVIGQVLLAVSGKT